MPASCEGVGALSNSTVDPIPALVALLSRPHIPVVQLYMRGELTRNDVFKTQVQGQSWPLLLSVMCMSAGVFTRVPNDSFDLLLRSLDMNYNICVMEADFADGECLHGCMRCRLFHA